MKTLLALAAALVFVSSAQAMDKPPANPDDYTCRFADLPPMRIQRHDAMNWTLRIDNGLPVKLSVGSQYATADIDGQQLLFWEDGDSVRIADVLFKGTCQTETPTIGKAE